MIYESEATGTTPNVIFDIESHVFRIVGRSLAENAVSFYMPMIQWLKENLTGKSIQATMDVKLDYCNTSSYLGMIQVFKMLQELNEGNCSFTVNWQYEEGDEDWLEDGKNFEECVKVPFTFESFVFDSEES